MNGVNNTKGLALYAVKGFGPRCRHGCYMAIQKMTALTDFFDPVHPFFYLTLGNKTKPILIRRLHKLDLMIDVHEEIKKTGKVRGFLVAKDGQGILEIEGKPNASALTEERFDVMTICIDESSMKLTNRRQFVRLIYNPPVSITLKDDSAELSVDAFNISAGGLCVIPNAGIIPDKIYLLTYAPSNEFHLECGVQFIPPRNLDQNLISHPPYQVLTGATPLVQIGLFTTEKNITNYPIVDEKKQEMILRYINKVLIEQRRQRRG